VVDDFDLVIGQQTFEQIRITHITLSERHIRGQSVVGAGPRAEHQDFVLARFRERVHQMRPDEAVATCNQDATHRPHRARARRYTSMSIS